MRVFIAVTHLLGAGHLTRAVALGRAFARHGCEVVLVSGGIPTSLADTTGVTVRQLPPVQADGVNFKSLLDGTGRSLTVDYLAQRETMLSDLYHAANPDILITELFPFGRRILKNEFLRLVTEARASSSSPLVLASVRDILATPSTSEKIDETHAILSSFYDAVLVHSDPNFIGLDASWPHLEEISDIVLYTGYIDENGGQPEERSRSGIVVSGGSSLASLPLYRAALRAARLAPHLQWRILTGRGVPDSDYTSLMTGRPDNAVVERARPDFRTLLAGAELSVSQAGYNTVIDLLAAAPRALFVPFEAEGETEQMLRATTLARHGFGYVLTERELSPDTLLDHVEQQLRMPLPARAAANLDGADYSASLALRLYDLLRGPP